MEEATEERKKPGLKRLGIVLALVLAAVGIGAFLVYLSSVAQELSRQQEDQTRQIKDLRDQVQSLGGEIDEAEEQLEALRAKAAQAPAAPQAPAKPALSYSGAVKHDTPAYDGFYLLVVDVAVTNRSDRAAYFAPYDLKLKDAQNNAYPLLSQSAVGRQPRFVGGAENLPGGRVELSPQEVKPGETLKGSVVFYVTRENVNQFEMSYEGETYKVSL